MKKLTEKPELLIIKDTRVCVLTWYNNDVVLDLKTSQEQVFNHLNLKINAYFDEELTHAKFMDYCLKNFDSDVFIFFDLDCIPLDERVLENMVEELIKEDCIIGIEQSANHINADFIYAGPACFGITKNVYDKIGGASFDGTYRSDVAQEYTYLSYEKGILVKFFELISSKNNKWRLGRDRFFGNGCLYSFKDSNIYHQFQTGIEEQKEDFKLECQKVINNEKK